MDQLRRKTLDWKCKQCFRDPRAEIKIRSNQKPQPRPQGFSLKKWVQKPQEIDAQ